MKAQAGLNSREGGWIGKGHCNHPRAIQLLCDSPRMGQRHRSPGQTQHDPTQGVAALCLGLAASDSSMLNLVVAELAKSFGG